MGASPCHIPRRKKSAPQGLVRTRPRPRQGRHHQRRGLPYFFMFREKGNAKKYVLTPNFSSAFAYYCSTPDTSSIGSCVTIMPPTNIPTHTHMSHSREGVSFDGFEKRKTKLTVTDKTPKTQKPEYTKVLQGYVYLGLNVGVNGHRNSLPWSNPSGHGQAPNPGLHR